MTKKQSNIVIFFIMIFSFTINAQTDWQKWERQEVSYELPTFSKRDFTLDNANVGMTFLSFSRNAYYFLISDLDGDNCPFYPSCSTFFVDAVKETNYFTGILMFADRFTRDMNPLKTESKYPIHKYGKYFDPPYNYTLNLQKIKL